LNLFLSQEEVKQLLGLEHELFYVKDGLINEVKRYGTVTVFTGVPELIYGTVPAPTYVALEACDVPFSSVALANYVP